jgi:hypothetical protein
MQQPTLAGFIDFIRGVMGIDPLLLPDNSPAIEWAYANSLMIVNPTLGLVGVKSPIETTLYIEAVYNLGGDNIINYAPDQPGRTYFAELRRSMNITSFAAGVVQSASDSGTSDSLAVPEALKNLTISQLQNMKTPWGRRYLAIAQTYGTMWGVA